MTEEPIVSEEEQQQDEQAVTPTMDTRPDFDMEPHPDGKHRLF